MFDFMTFIGQRPCDNFNNRVASMQLLLLSDLTRSIFDEVNSIDASLSG